MINVVELWLISLSLINLILFTIGLIVFMPKKVYKTSIDEFYRIFKEQRLYLIIIFGVVLFHLIEVNIIDSTVTEWIGYDFANNIQHIEGNIIYLLSQYWTPAIVYFLVIMYIAVYPFTLWFSPIYFIATDEKKAMKTLAYGLLLIYSIALPFYLFMPITNVYTFYNLESALSNVIPTVENFFYITTTQNNCLPSLHVAMSILIARSVHLTGNKKLSYFTYFCTASVIISVIYLAIHWITDVICGTLLAIVTIFLLNQFIKDE
ncbi:MAG: phosphatase PAP2 family protein [Candidatus Thermoplasmatota archaeon]|nr:phosphatase PAP2 family protein [Candidatus Thermoplasmatota archaeon]